MPAAPGDAGYLGGLHAAYLPVTRAVWERKARFGDDRRDESVARQAWEQNGFAFYRWFAAFPAVHHVDRSNPATCVWFEDLRFFIPGRSFYPFRYGMCQEAYGSWAPYRIGSGGAPAPLR
jgi:inner membrane protein